MPVLPSPDIKPYVELTPPNVDSVEQMNSIFEMSHDGSLAETERTNFLFTKSDALDDSLATAQGASYIRRPLSMSALIEPTTIPNNTESAGIDTTRSIKWNENFTGHMTATQTNAFNILEAAGQTVYQKSVLGLPDVNIPKLTVASGVGGTLTTNLDQPHWNTILPHFSSLHSVEANNSNKTELAVFYLDTFGLDRYGILNIETLQFTPLWGNSASKFDLSAAERTAWSVSVFYNTNSNTAYPITRRCIYDQENQKVAIIAYWRLYRATSASGGSGNYTEASNSTYARFYLYDLATGTWVVDNVASDVIHHRVANQYAYRERTQVLVSGNQDLLYHNDGIAKTYTIWSQSAYDPEPYYYTEFYGTTVTYVQVNFLTNTFTVHRTVLARQQDEDMGAVTTQYCQDGNNFSVIMSGTTRWRSSPIEPRYFVECRSFNMVAGTNTALISPMTWARNDSVTWSVNVHGNLIVARAHNVSTSTRTRMFGILSATDTVFWYYNTNSITGSSASFGIKYHPTGIETRFESPTGTPSGYALFFKEVTFDGAIDDITVYSAVGISPFTQWYVKDGVRRPYSIGSSNFVRIWNSSYEVSHTISQAYTEGDLILASNRPFISPTFIPEYMDSATITNTASGTDEFGYATNTDTSMQVKYTLHGYPLENFTADNVFVIKED